MMNCFELPEGYKEIFQINLVENRKMMLLLNGAAIMIAVIMAVVMVFFVPFTAILDVESGIYAPILRSVTILAGCFIYIILHELTHGVFIKKYSGKKAHYGFKGGCAYAGSDAYFDRKSYIVIALAPIVIWGVILLVLNFLVPIEWFWVVYIIQIMNVSGAVGDLYVTIKFSGMPEDILVTDCGVGMTVYSRN